MEPMTKMMDYTISSLPIQITDLKVDKSKLSIKSVVVTAVGHLPGRISRRIKVSFNNWAIGYIFDGNGTYQAGNGPVQKIKSGSLFFIWPGEVYSYGPNNNETWEEYYISFEGDRAEEWVSNQLIRKNEVMQIGADKMWKQKIETIASLLHSGIPTNGDRAAMQLESLLFEFSLMTEHTHNNARTDKMLYIIDDLAHHVYEPIDADQIAARLNISVSTLRRLVRLHTGYPLNEFLHRLKISEAKKKLINTDDSVKEVALALCYEDVYYFSRLFKKYSGVSAKAFRNSI